jgi:hypothetical protein
MWTNEAGCTVSVDRGARIEFAAVVPVDSRRKSMACKKASLLTGLFAMATGAQQLKPSQPQSEPMLAYAPSLDPAAMDRTADPCVDFDEYSCGGVGEK